MTLQEAQSAVVTSGGDKIINGRPASEENQLRQIGNVTMLRGQETAPSGGVGPFEFLAAMSDPNTTVRHWQNAKFTDSAGSAVTPSTSSC